MRQFSWCILTVFLSLSIIIFFAQITQNIRLIAYSDSMIQILKLSLIEAPYIIKTIIENIFIISTIFFFYKVNHEQTLTTIRCLGGTIWHFIIPCLITTFIFGILVTLVLQPLTTITQQKTQEIRSQLAIKKPSLLALSTNGLWIRENHQNGYSVIHTKNILSTTPLVLGKTIYLSFSKQSDMKERIDSEKTLWKPGKWEFINNWSTKLNSFPVKNKSTIRNTILSNYDIQNYHSTPHNISLIKMNQHIKSLGKQQRHNKKFIYFLYQSILLPIMLCGVFLLITCLNINITRYSKTIYYIPTSFILPTCYILFCGITLFSSKTSSIVPSIHLFSIVTIIPILYFISFLIYKDDS